MGCKSNVPGMAKDYMCVWALLNLSITNDGHAGTTYTDRRYTLGA